MQSGNGLSLFIRVLLPLLIGAAIKVHSIPFQLHESLQSVFISGKEGSADIAQDYAVIVEMQPWRGELLEKTGVLFYQQENWTQSIHYFTQAEKKALLSMEGFDMLADAFYQIQDYDSAVAVWEKMLRISPTSDELYKKIAELQAALGREEEQIATYQEWLQSEPENADLYYHLGLLLSLREPQQSIQMLNLAKTFDPNRTENVKRLVEVLALAEEEDERYSLLQTGRALSSIGEWEFARQAFERVIEIDPEYGEAWAFLGEALQHLGLPSLEAIRQANALSPDSVVVKALTAMYWRRQNDPDQALNVLDEIMRLEPDEEMWLVEKGYVMAQSGDLKAASELFLEAIEREPNDGLYRREFIRFSLQNNYEIRSKALPAARQYLVIDEESSQSLDTMGWVLLTLQDHTSARRYLTRALEKDPRNASAHLHLGQAFLAQDDKPQALAHLTQAAALHEVDPQSAALARALLEKYFSGSG